ncbi:MAG: transposase [Proteobacteria bacterium]|nr:transposase [Pseudomonadota bacterium]
MFPINVKETRRNKCQNHETIGRLERQCQKLPPADYFPANFTLPAELRPMARYRPKIVHDPMFETASGTLRDKTGRKRFLDGDIGATGALRTDSRKLGYHPRVHFVVPGCAFNKAQNICRRTETGFLVPGAVLGCHFRKRFLEGLKELRISYPDRLRRTDWVVDRMCSGKGEKALEYLSRYLYRGVVSVKNIVSDRDIQVAFRYKNSQTDAFEYRTLPGLRFVALILRHVLPKGFGRVRDCGFLHGNAKKTLVRLRLVLPPGIRDQPVAKRPAFICSTCGRSMLILQARVFFRRIGKNSRSPPLRLSPEAVS